MWQRINDNQAWILIILGAILILFAARNLIDSIYKDSIEKFNFLVPEKFMAGWNKGSAPLDSPPIVTPLFKKNRCGVVRTR